jgi:hypothetical protein
MTKRGPIPTYWLRDNDTWFAWEKAGELHRGEAADFASRSSACSDGAAEWLGQWVAWDDRPGSACLAALAATRLPVDHWVVVERR